MWTLGSKQFARLRTDAVVVFTFNRSFYPTTSAAPPVSFLILHPRGCSPPTPFLVIRFQRPQSTDHTTLSHVKVFKKIQYNRVETTIHYRQLFFAEAMMPHNEEKLRDSPIGWCSRDDVWRGELGSRPKIACLKG